MIDAMAAQLFEQAAERFRQQSRDMAGQLESASCFEDASKMYRMAKRMSECHACLRHAAGIYAAQDRSMIRAARTHESLGQSMYSTGDHHEASNCFEHAAELFQHENDLRWVQCVMKVSECHVALQRYDQARLALERALDGMKDDAALSFQVPGVLLSIGFCYLALSSEDAVRMDKWLISLHDIYPSFTESREYAILCSLNRAMMNQDADAWDREWQNYTKWTPVGDAWKLKVVEHARAAFNEESLT